MRINANDPLRILIAKNDDENHEFFIPKSPQGELLVMGWQAVPALIDALEDEELSIHKRAWILSLLFSITLERELDPTVRASRFSHMPRGLLPDYTTGSVSTVKWKNGFSQGWNGGREHFGVELNPEAQRAFAKKWFRFRDEYIVVETEK